MNATPTESAQALEAFVCYRDLGAARSIVAVSQQLGKSKTIIDRWSRTHNWVERCRQHDEAIAAEAAERDKQARLAELDKRRQDRIKVAAAVRGVTVKALPLMLPKDLALRPDSIVRLLTYADSLERLDMGEATERIELKELPNDALIARARDLGLIP